MNTETNSRQLNFVYDLFKGMQDVNFGYIYRGKLDSIITDYILSLAEANLQKEEETRIKKKIFFILVECLQNIIKHQDLPIEIPSDKSDYLVIQKRKLGYLVTTGNFIENSKINFLKTLIEKINTLDKDELKQFSKEILATGEMSKKSGAGLGLIEIARKSGSKLLYEFKNITEKYSYFYLHTKIDLTETPSAMAEKNSLQETINTHNILNENNISLIFNGIFSQESILNLLSITESQMPEALALKKKIFKIMIEMLQNIVKHADSPLNLSGENNTSIPEGNQAIFIISRNNSDYLLTSGNFIQNEKIGNLMSKINDINNLTEQDLLKIYDKSLFNFEIDNVKEAGLGLIDIRLKSKKNINFAFIKINETFSFFILQSII